MARPHKGRRPSTPEPTAPAQPGRQPEESAEKIDDLYWHLAGLALVGVFGVVIIVAYGWLGAGMLLALVAVSVLPHELG